MSTCRSCGAEIVWATTLSDKAIPVDKLPREDGNIYLMSASDPRDPPIAITMGGAVERGFTPPIGKAKYVSHFASCPNADHHRKGKR